MALTLYLAMTAAEMHSCAELPEHVAWMACHFSPYGNGLSNTPSQLPARSVLILNDRIPPFGHDPQIVAHQLRQIAESCSASRVLLDLQRPDIPETAAIAKAIIDTLPCPVGITPAYADSFSCPIFLTPALRRPLSEQLAPWSARQIWLDAALDCEILTITEQGCEIFPGCIPEAAPYVHTDEELFCQYSLELDETFARFTVWRNMEQLQKLLLAAEGTQVECAIGLYQQLRKATAEDD